MPTNAKWSKDTFTKMVKEYGDKIAGISDRVEKELKEMLEEEKQIELFESYASKKKLNNSAVGGEVLNSKSTFQPIFAYDLGITSLMEADDFENLDEIPDDLEYEDDNPDNEILDLDEISRTELDHIKRIASPFVTEFIELTGKNLYNFAVSFLENGPGLANFNIFDGMADLFYKVMTSNFIKQFSKMYNADYRLRKAYETIVQQLGKNKNTIHKNLLILAKNASKLVRNDDTSNINKEQVVLFKGVVNVLSILLNKYYFPIISKEMDNGIKNGKLLVDALIKFRNDMNKIIKEHKNADERAGWVAQAYLNHFADGRFKSISAMFFTISSAISLSHINQNDNENNQNDDESNQSNKKYEPLIKKITFDDDEITQMQSLERSYFASINNNILSLKLDNTKYLNINYKMFIDFINKNTKDKQIEKFLLKLQETFKEKSIDMKNESEQNKLVIFKLLMQSVATFEENIFSRKKIAEVVDIGNAEGGSS